MKRYQLTTQIWEEEGVYVSQCRDIKVASCGATPKEALDNLREAIDLWLKNAEFLGISTDTLPLITSSEKFTSMMEVEAA